MFVFTNSILNGLNTALTTNQAYFGCIVLGRSATSLVKGNGTLLTGAGFVKGDATLDNTIYPTLTAETNFTTTFTCGGATSPSFTINIRRISNGTNTVVFLCLPQIVFTTGAVGGTCSSNSLLPANARPFNSGGANYNLSIISVQSNTTYSVGLLWIFPSGLITISPSLAGGSPANAPVSVPFGLLNQHCLSYVSA